MERQKKLIEKKEWDYLLILDACRYDYLKDLNRKEKFGKLHKVKPNSNDTPTWLKKTFDRKHDDIIYVSANPFINSKSVETVKGFDASNIFFDVIDVWEKGWKEDDKTVPPQEMRKEIIKANEKYKNKKIIGHFMQPHTPYLSLGPVDGGISRSKKATLKKQKINVLNNIKSSMAQALKLRKLYSKLIHILGINKNQVGKVAERYGVDGLRKAYKENLEIALKEIKIMLKYLNGDIVISSDHGEWLGENNKFGHARMKLPWLEVKK
ncbi:hypothetical protein C9439_03805 [archaeon SCG-AAA382B04]|nr:hypothetical protein C9439_03805 [archaeon SCG-AAA382B04]